jgi:hypothetical protein
MNSTYIIYNHKHIPMTLIGTDQKLLPTLLKALKYNKLTIGRSRRHWRKLIDSVLRLLFTPLKEINSEFRFFKVR